MRRSNGFTLLEMLVAMGVLLVVLGVVLVFLVQSNRSYVAQERVSDRQAAADSAIQLMVYEVGLAGYKGVGENDPTKSFASGSNTLVINRGGGTNVPDEITVRYFEDRFVGAPQEVVVSYSVDTAAGRLIRREGTADPQEMIDGVSNLKVVQFLRRDGVRVDVTSGTTNVPGNLAAINVEITLVDGNTWRFPIATANPQVAAIN